MNNALKTIAVLSTLLLIALLLWLTHKPPTSSSANRSLVNRQASVVIADASIADKDSSARLGPQAVPDTLQANQEVTSKTILLDFDSDGKMERIELIPSDGKVSDQVPLVVWADGRQTIIERGEAVEFPRPQLIEVVNNADLSSLNIPNDNAVGDAILITKLESSSAVIYWDGSKFKSQWLGD